MHPIPRLAYLLGSTQDIYMHWAKKNKMTVCIDDIGENAKLLWILDKSWEGKIPNRVVLYLHGGGFHLPMFEDSASFWSYVQQELKRSDGLDVGVGILDFSESRTSYDHGIWFEPYVSCAALFPEANFPIPLMQTITAIRVLLSRGIKPSNIILMGDSAGANLAIQVLLHILHPLPGLSALFNSPMDDSESRFAGAYLMSPWSTLLPREDYSHKSYEENATWDIISPSTLVESGSAILSGVEDDHLPYIDSYFAPPNWYDNMGTVVRKVLITAGRHECLREDIIQFGKKVEMSNARGDLDMKMVVDQHGVHDDPLFDFIIGEKKLGELTPMMISWCRDAFYGSQTSTSI